MVSSATKTSKNINAVQPKTANTTFFRKAGEQSFFSSKENPSFFGKPLQTKLTVSTPDDPHEKEADAVADKVMRMPEPVAIAASPIPAKEEKLERKEEEEVQAKQETPVINKISCKQDNEEKLHTKSETIVYRNEEKHLDTKQHETIDDTQNVNINRKNISLHHSDVIQCSGRGPPQTSIQFEQNLSASKGSGTKLPDDTRMFMESRFNADFSNVRVHNDSTAQQMNNHVQAKAFAHGNDIYFNSGNYAPASSGGRQLLAHELTHTIQQGASPVNNTVAPKQFANQRNTIQRAPQQPASSQIKASGIDISNKSGGSALPDDAKEYFRHSFKADTSDIRVHTDDEATEICRSRKVPAFTQVRHICFDPSRYSPGSEEGGKLLAKQVSASLAQRSITVNKVKGKEPVPAKQTAIKTAPKDKKKTGPKGKGDKNKKGVGKHKGKQKGDKSDGPAVKSVKANPKKSPAHPDEDPAFQRVVGKTKATAKKQKDHVPAESKATDAQKAAPAAPKEAESKAKERKTDGIDEAGKEDAPFDAKSFKAELLKKIEDVTPKTLEDATEFKKNNKIGDVKNVMGDKVAGEKQDTTGPVAKATAQPAQVNDADNKHPLPLPPTPKGPKPAGVGASDAAPKPKLDNEISLQDQSKSLDDEMKANNVTEDQLAKSNEPSFTAALDQKKSAQKDAVEKPKQYRKDEKLMLNQAKAVTQEQSTHALAGMDAERGKNFGMVVQHQQTTKEKDHLTRSDVTKQIETLYAAAEEKVKKALEDADTGATKLFDEGSEAARNAFENYVDGKMTAYKRERYSGFWGGLSWLEDKIFGMPDEVNVFYTDGRQMYLDKMDQVITQVANFVTARLNEAKQAIKDGKKQIDDYVNKLPENLAEVGKQAASDIGDKFDSLEQSVNDKKDQLIEGLAKKYVDNVKKIDDRIGEMKEANAGLIDAAIGFLKKVWQVIKDLTNLFTTILSRLASIIGTILSSPGGFFENLGKAFKQGFNNFKDKFLDYLEQGLMDWLATNLGIAGIELPKEFSVTAIFTLVLQVLGLTKQHIKERAIAILGERKVKLLETAGGILYRVYNEGLGALWEMIKEKLTDLKDVIWEAIKSFIKTKIIEAAIVFLLSLLNPIGAFIKVCMAIYDFLMMLVRFKDRIIELLDSILKAVTDVASGAIDGAANAIEKAFAKSIPVIIGFLAALLHLNDIAAKVRDIITRIRAKVDKAIDFVITKADAWVGKYVEGALRLQDKGMAMVEKGKQAVIGAGKKVVGAVAGWLGLREDFTAKDGHSHSLYFEGKGSSAKLILASVNPKSVEERIHDAKNATTDNTEKSKYDQALQKVALIRQDIQKVETSNSKDTIVVEEQLAQHLNQLKNILIECKIDGAEIPLTNVTYKTHSMGMAEEVIAQPLTNFAGNTKGSDADGNPLGWNIATHLNVEARQASKIPQSGKGGTVPWKQVHLLSAKLHGPGSENWNLTPSEEAANAGLRSLENRVKAEFLKDPKTIYDFYRVVVEYKYDNSPQNHPIKGPWNTIYFPSAVKAYVKKSKGSVEKFEPLVDELKRPSVEGIPQEVNYFARFKVKIDTYFATTAIDKRSWSECNDKKLHLESIGNKDIEKEVGEKLKKYYNDNKNG